MSSSPKSGMRMVRSSGKIDGGVFRLVKLPDGSARVEEWGPDGWKPGVASLGEIFDAPPVTSEFAARLGIPIEDLEAVTDQGGGVRRHKSKLRSKPASNRQMSVSELKALARKHWEEWLPEKVKALKAEGKLNEALQGAANLAQTEIEHLMKHGYHEHEAREVALPQFIVLPPEGDGLDDWEREELEKLEREYQKNPPVEVQFDRDTDEMLATLEQMKTDKVREVKAEPSTSTSTVNPSASSTVPPDGQSQTPASPDPSENLSPLSVNELATKPPSRSVSRRQKLFGAVVPSDENLKVKIIDASDPEGHLAQVFANQSFPASYRVFLVNASDHDIAKIEIRTSGFEGATQLNVVTKHLGPLQRGKGELVEELDYEMLDYVLWYHLDICFSDGLRLKASFTINKAYSLKPDRYRLCPALGKDAYHFPLEPPS